MTIWYLMEPIAEQSLADISIWAFTMFLWNLTLADMPQAVIWHRLALNPEKLELEPVQ